MSDSNDKLFDASREGNYEVVKQLLRSRAVTDINWRNPAWFGNWSSLHAASYSGYTSIVQELLNHQADVNITNNYQVTSLHYAARNGHAQTLAVLLAHPQVNINAVTEDNRTTLYNAASNNHQDCVQLLLDAQADITIRSKSDGRTALEAASTQEIRSMIENHNKPVRARTFSTSTTSSTMQARPSVIRQAPKVTPSIPQSTTTSSTIQTTPRVIRQAPKVTPSIPQSTTTSSTIQTTPRVIRQAPTVTTPHLPTITDTVQVPRLVLEQPLQSQTTRIQQLQSQVTTLQTQVQQAQTREQQLQHQLTTSQTQSQQQINQLQQTIQGLRTTSQTQQTRIQQLYTSNQQLRATITELQGINTTSTRTRPASSTPTIDDQWKIPTHQLQIDYSSTLGTGALGEVKQACWNGISVAVKRLYFMATDAAALRAMGGELSPEVRQAALADFVRECTINASIRHPNIVMFIGVSVDTTTQQPQHLVLEYMDGGSLFNELYGTTSGTVTTVLRSRGVLALSRVVSILRDVCNALVYLHSRTPPILHLDIKPKNVLIEQATRRAKLADLGESHVVQATRRATVGVHGVGTPVYMAPEMALEEGLKGAAADMFSFGVLATEVASGKEPNPGVQLVRTGAMFAVVPERTRRAADIEAIQYQEIRELVEHLILDEAGDRWNATQVQQYLGQIAL